MAAGIAHEIRNPLASMSGSIQVLRQELPLSDEQAQLMDIVLRESERLNETIRQLPRLRPAAARRVDADRRRGACSTDTAPLLRNSAEVRERPRHRGRRAGAARSWFEADEGQVRQIVWNLATNGLRAMPRGGRASAAVPAAADGRAGARTVVLRSRTRASASRPRISTGSSSRSAARFARGTGLGLAIVHRIVSDYDGEMQVDVGARGTGRRSQCACRVQAAAPGAAARPPRSR